MSNEEGSLVSSLEMEYPFSEVNLEDARHRPGIRVVPEVVIRTTQRPPYAHGFKTYLVNTKASEKCLDSAL